MSAAEPGHRAGFFISVAESHPVALDEIRQDKLTPEIEPLIVWAAVSPSGELDLDRLSYVKSALRLRKSEVDAGWRIAEVEVGPVSDD